MQATQVLALGKHVYFELALNTGALLCLNMFGNGKGM